tara:strand:+ start:2508 stop:2675 length:168 start_codon:yes stop_codon:yes gene_type:complete
MYHKILWSKTCYQEKLSTYCIPTTRPAQKIIGAAESLSAFSRNFGRGKPGDKFNV